MINTNQTVIALLESVSVQRQAKIFLKDFSISIEQGSHILFTGESAVAKVALEVLAGLINISSGKLQYPGIEAVVHKKLKTDPLYNHRRLIALVNAQPDFRNRAHMPGLYYQQRFNSMDAEDSPTVLDYLKEQQNGITDAELKRIIAVFKLRDLVAEELIKLSSGETRRLQLAAAVIRNPLLLLLDNPMAGLDVQTRKSLSAILGELRNSGITIIQTGDGIEIPEGIQKAVYFEKEGDYAVLDAPFTFKAMPVIEDENKNVIPILTPLTNAVEYTIIADMKNIHISYGDKKILDDVSWTIKQGERWLLKGRNGAGKSTLLSLINGDNPQAFANEIILFDRKKGSGESIWDIKSKTGYFSPELYRYFPREQSCIHVIESGFHDTAGLFRQPDPEKKNLCRQWMEYFEIENFAARSFSITPEPVQRLCLLIRAFIKIPTLLILDEPCQGLDSHQQKQFTELIDEICRRTNITLIYVSHYDHEIPECITDVLVLENGKVVS